MENIYKVISLMERINNIDKYGYSSLLTEISIKDKFQKETQIGKNKLQFDLFQQLCQLDPTTTPNKVGKYSNWILAKYNPNVDLNALRIALEWYADGIKNNIIKQLGISTDINTFKSYDELISTIDGIRHSDDAQLSNSEYNNRQKLEGQFKILGSTQSYDIVQPLTFKAERYFGSGTEWCTVANEYYFNRYTKNGALFILYPKNGDKKMKMQFHFESKSFANYEDRVYRTPIECIESVIDNENEMNNLLQLCKRIWNEYEELFITLQDRAMDAQRRLNNGENPNDIFDNVARLHNGLYVVVLMKKYNYLRPDNTYVWEGEKWFDGAGYFSDGLARVYIEGKGYNFLRPDGTTVWEDEKWFDETDKFYDGTFRVYIKGKGYNYLCLDGTLVRKPEEKWFDKIYDFKNGFARVYIEGKGYNFLRPDGTTVRKDEEKWFDEAVTFINGFAMVYIEGRGWNFLCPDGTEVWEDKDKWFDGADYFSDGLARVYIEGKGYNFLRSNGTLVRKPEEKWFDDANKFNYNLFARVVLDGETFKLDKVGNLHRIY